MGDDSFNAALNDAIQEDNPSQIRSLLRDLEWVDIADILTHSPPPTRRALWNNFDEALKGDVIAFVDQDIVGDLLVDLRPDEIAQIIERVPDADDLADIIQQLPDDVSDEILETLDEANRKRIEKILIYPADSAGGLMDTSLVSIRKDITIDVVLRYLRRHKELPPGTDQLFVVDQDGRFIGSLSINTILISSPTDPVEQLMDQRFAGVPATLPRSEVADVFKRYDLISVAVIDEEGYLIGRITIDDVVDVIVDEADHSILGRAGLSEDDDTFAPILQSFKSRAIWLGANLLTAFLASSVINLFEETIEKVVALAVLMPIVASMGGVAGSQTLTLVIRGIAQGAIQGSNSSWLIRREIALGVINGMGWALIVSGVTFAFFDDITLAIIIAFAMVLNITIAALSGSLLPKILTALRIDPAVAGMVVLTTITDVVGFLSFLGLATYFYA